MIRIRCSLQRVSVQCPYWVSVCIRETLRLQQSSYNSLTLNISASFVCLQVRKCASPFAPSAFVASPKGIYPVLQPSSSPRTFAKPLHSQHSVYDSLTSPVSHVISLAWRYTPIVERIIISKHIALADSKVQFNTASRRSFYVPAPIRSIRFCSGTGPTSVRDCASSLRVQFSSFTVYLHWINVLLRFNSFSLNDTQ